MNRQACPPAFWQMVIDSLEEWVTVMTPEQVVLANAGAFSEFHLSPDVAPHGLWERCPWLQRYVHRVLQRAHIMFVSGPYKEEHLVQWAIRALTPLSRDHHVLLIGRTMSLHVDQGPLALTTRQLLFHDAQTPLTSLLGYCAMLLRGDLGPLTAEQRQALEHMHYSVTTLHHLIRQAMQEERPFGKGIPRERLDLVRLIQEVAVEMDSLAQRQRVTVHLAIPTTPVTVHAAPFHIRQVLYNLLGNAIKYTPAGGRITIEVEVSETEVSVQVQDTGPGLTWQDFHAIGHPFVKSKDITRPQQGTGLGLFIVQQLIAGHGGSFWAEPHPERGSIFAFTLPIASHVHCNSSTQTTTFTPVSGPPAEINHSP